MTGNISRVFERKEAPIVEGGVVLGQEQKLKLEGEDKTKGIVIKTYNMFQAKRDQTRRGDLMLELIKEKATNIKLCNDLMLMTKDSTVILRDRVKDMSVVKF